MIPHHDGYLHSIVYASPVLRNDCITQWFIKLYRSHVLSDADAHTHSISSLIPQTSVNLFIRINKLLIQGPSWYKTQKNELTLCFCTAANLPKYTKNTGVCSYRTYIYIFTNRQASPRRSRSRSSSRSPTIK